MREIVFCMFFLCFWSNYRYRYRPASQGRGGGYRYFRWNLLVAIGFLGSLNFFSKVYGKWACDVRRFRIEKNFIFGLI
jgi:hypothetical protein